MPDIYWLIAAQRSLLSALTSDPRIDEEQYEAIYRRLCRVLAATFPDAAAVVVRKRLHGYRNRSEIHILLVEAFARVVTLDAAGAKHSPEGDRPGPGAFYVGWPDFADHKRCDPTRTTAHIVKIVTRVPQPGESGEDCRAKEVERLESEIDAFESVRPIGMTHHGVLMVLRCGARDADGKLESIIYEDAQHVLGGPHVVHLEEAVLDAVRWGLPTAESLKLTLKCIYEQLGNDFYARAFVRPTAEENHEAIRDRLERYVAAWRDAVKPAATPQPERFRVRREVVSFLGPKRDGFLDPADYLRSVLKCPQFCPLLLWGPAHGDLHGHNILLSLADGDATLPAVYDYEEMGPNKLIGWDFVKLETELKVRALPLVYAGSEASYLTQVYEFECYLARRTQALHDHMPFEEQLEDPAARLAELVMAIRAAAHEHMGRRRYRDRQWLEEYYFLLALYAICAGRYETYQRRHLMAAWISGGVAARLLSRPWYNLAEEIRTQVRQAEEYLEQEGFDPKGFDLKPLECEMSHHARLAFAHTWCRSGKPPFIEAAAELLEKLRDDYPHILEIEEELALQYLELGDRPKTELLLDEVSRRYNLSEEILCRMGRQSKDLGAEKEVTSPGEAPAYYLQALLWYQKAYELRRNYYPGINVATLHCLLGDKTKAQEVAQAVLLSLDQVVDPQEITWARATRGEAYLLLDRDEEAAEAYRTAMAEKSLRDRDRRSARRQAELIIRRLPPEQQAFWTPDRLDDVFGPI